MNFRGNNRGNQQLIKLFIGGPVDKKKITSNLLSSRDIVVSCNVVHGFMNQLITQVASPCGYSGDIVDIVGIIARHLGNEPQNPKTWSTTKNDPKMAPLRLKNSCILHAPILVCRLPAT